MLSPFPLWDPTFEVRCGEVRSRLIMYASEMMHSRPSHHFVPKLCLGTHS